jgi:hypothetical protein
LLWAISVGLRSGVLSSATARSSTSNTFRPVCAGLISNRSPSWATPLSATAMPSNSMALPLAKGPLATTVPVSALVTL